MPPPASTTPSPTAQPKLPPVTVEPPPNRPRPTATRPAPPPPAAPPRRAPAPTNAERQRASASQPPQQPQQPQQPQTASTAQSPAAGTATTPGPNLNAVPSSATRLDLPVLEAPVSVDVVNQATIQNQGYRTNVDVAQGAVGVLAIDVGGANAGFSMRGFTFDQINILYNGINLGPQDLTGRTMNAFMFDRVEFLKGASALESGQGAIGGSVNYVSKEPTSGPVKNEAFTSLDSFGSVRSGFGSGGSTPIAGLDYRFDMAYSHVNSFIDGDTKQLSSVATRLNYQNSDVLKTWIAFEYYHDAGNAYFGTPLVPVAFSGPFATTGVVSGANALLGPVTVDSRTLTTNYNVLDNYNAATQYFLRGGFDLEIAPNITVKDQAYGYHATRTFTNSETYTFDTATNMVNRDRFFVSHDQNLIGNIANMTWNSHFLGMDNRFAAELAASHNKITFKESTFTNSFTDEVSLIAPARGLFGPLATQTRIGVLDTISESFEDRLKLTPNFALIGGVRIDEFSMYRSASIDAGGIVEPGFPFSAAWNPVSYRAAYTWEPIPKMVFYSLYSTSYDPAATAIFELQPGQATALTSSRIYETGVKQSLWNNAVEWTLAAYDLNRRNVYEQVQAAPPLFALAGEIRTTGIEFNTAIRPYQGFKLWGNIALTHSRFVNDSINGALISGTTPPNVAPIIANVGASYRFEDQYWWRWMPIEFGSSVRYVGNRYLFDDNQVVMDNYLIADAYMFIDFKKPGWFPNMDLARLGFRVRNLTNTVYAAYADPSLQNQVLLGEPRTYEASLSFKW
jgi:iron complex outermembrane recepter protein